MKLSITKTLAAASATFGLALFAACEDASSTAASPENTKSEATPGITVVDSYKSLPDCKNSNEGAMVYVASTSEVYYCIESKWTPVNGKDGKDGKNGADGKDGENGKNGTDGSDGTGCSAKIDGNMIFVSCAGVVIDTITNGINGTNGTDGTNGQKGETGDNGKDGANGANCSAKTIAEGIEISCAGEVVDTLTNGKDGKNGTICSARENSAGDGVEIVCDNGETTSIAYRTNGTDGTTCTAQDYADLETGKTGYMLICDGKEMGIINNVGDDADGSGLCTIEERTNGYIALICGNKVANLQGYIPESSSSRERPTSSEIGPTSSEDDLCAEKTLADNQMCDPRDGTVYKTVKIGDATWFAENIYYEDVIKKRKRGGEILYLQTDEVCPNGWHVPSKAEFENLVAATGETDAKKQAMALASTDWKVTDDDDNVIWNGTNVLGFNIQPTGNCGTGGGCWNEDRYAAFFTSTNISGSTSKYVMEFKIEEETLESGTKNYIGNSLNYSTEDTDRYFISIRCVKD